MKPETLIAKFEEQIEAHEKALEHMAGRAKGECDMCGGSNIAGQGMGLEYSRHCACLPSREAIKSAKKAVASLRREITRGK